MRMPSFIGLGCLVQILRGLVETPPDLQALKKPSPYRVNLDFGRYEKYLF